MTGVPSTGEGNALRKIKGRPITQELIRRFLFGLEGIGQFDPFVRDHSGFWARAEVIMVNIVLTTPRRTFAQAHGLPIENASGVENVTPFVISGLRDPGKQ